MTGPLGPKVLKVLKIDSHCVAEVCGIALGAMSIYAAYRRQRNSATYLFAEHGHSERSEESQHVEIVIHWLINTCERGKPYNRASPVENKQTALRALEMHPFWYLRYHLSPLGSMSLDSQSPVGSLRIQFLCHPGGGTLSGAMHRGAYEA